jgi:PTS system mannitol-specific IIC component
MSESEPPATGKRPHDLLDIDSVVLAGQATSRETAITEAGQLLVKAGAVEPSYVDAMHEREQSVSTHMGSLLAIPHGTNNAKSAIRRTAICFVRYPEPVDWDGKPTEFVIGIAGAGDDHLVLLSRIAEIFTDPDEVERLRTATVPAHARAVLIGST